MASMERLVIRPRGKPRREGLEDITEWFLDVFDLSARRGELEPVLFKEIAENSISGKGVTSKALNRKLSVPRSTVIYHLNRFIYSGLVVRRGRRYYLRAEDMESTIEDLRADMSREFERLMLFAERLDRIMESDTHGRKRRQRRKERGQ